MQTAVKSQPCKVTYKGKQHNGRVIDVQVDKVKVEILDDKGIMIKADWFENKEIKRLWS